MRKATVIFNSDDYWIYERLKQYAVRMNVIPVYDLKKPEAIAALAKYRRKYCHEEPSPSVLEKVYDLVGGRLSFLGKIAKTYDMVATANEICRMEKTWFLSQCGILGEEMDDDVMDQQKYASAAMVLASKLVDMEKGMERTYDPHEGHLLPQLPLDKARWVMTYERPEIHLHLHRNSANQITTPIGAQILSASTIQSTSSPSTARPKSEVRIPNRLLNIQITI